MNLVEGVVNFERNDNNTVCVLEATESFNINAGVYADLKVDVGRVTLGVGPAASITLFAGPTAAQCLEPATMTGGNDVTRSKGSDIVTQTQGGAVATDGCDEAIETVVSVQPQTQPTASNLNTLVTSRKVATITEHAVVTFTSYSGAWATV